MNRNTTSSFNNGNNNNGNNLNSQQQQFLRSNSWNVAQPNQNQQSSNQLSSSQDNNRSGTNSSTVTTSSGTFNPNSINGGHFILLRNVTAQIDQMTLKALCAQHASGVLTYYRYIPQMSCVIVRYNSKEEATNALGKLNSVSLSNTTIFTQALTENELK
jgi:hypothetical protein